VIPHLSDDSPEAVVVGHDRTQPTVAPSRCSSETRFGFRSGIARQPLRALGPRDPDSRSWGPCVVCVEQNRPLGKVGKRRHDERRGNARMETSRAPVRAGALAARRTSEGLSKREIIRCLKRYVAREVYEVFVA
jgi:hypothetical protein